MGVENGIYPPDLLSQTLGAEIGAGINDPTTRLCLDVDRGTEPLIAWICGLAHVTIAADDGDSDRRGCSEKGDAQRFHVKVEVAFNCAPT